MNSLFDTVLSWYQDPLFILFPIATSFLSIAAFLFFAFPWTLLAWFDPEWAKPFKVQQKPFQVQSYFKENMRLIFVNTSVVLTIMIILWPILRLSGIHAGEAPPWYEYVWQIAVFIVLDDFLYYWFHRGMHENKWLLKNVHSVHHHIRNPAAIAGNYFHWIELLLTAGLALVGPILLQSHIYIVYAWFIFRQWEAADGHTGYRFRWNPIELVPFYHGAPFHDAHHETYKGNYAGFLPVWDKVFKTESQVSKSLKKK